MTTQQQLITQARTWLETRFKHQGGIKKNYLNKGGVYCLGFIIGIAKELNLKSGVFDNNENELSITDFDDLEYSTSSSPNKLIEGFNKTCIKIDNLNNANIGDIILFNFEGQPKHIALISDIKINEDLVINKNKSLNNTSKTYYIIHSYIKSNGVVEHLMDEEWINRIMFIYRMKKLI